MSDVTAERRLALIRSIREENHKNRISMKNREHILYGKEKEYETASVPNTGEIPESPAHSSTLVLRTIIAAILLSLFIIMDYLQADLPVDMETINDCLGENYAVNIIDFMDKITYTLDSENSPAAE